MNGEMTKLGPGRGSSGLSSPQWQTSEPDKLGHAMAMGGLQEFQMFVAAHQSMALWSARRFARWYGLEREDAEQVCALGVIRAAQKWDPDRGVRFAKYAYYWMRALCRHYAQTCGSIIRIPDHLFDRLSSLRQVAEQQLVAGGPEAKREEIDRRISDDPFLYCAWQTDLRCHNRHSLSDPQDLEGRSARRLIDQTESPVAAAMRREMAEYARLAVEILSEPDRTIARLRYGFDGPPKTLEQIGRKLHLTRERVRQREVAIRKHLRSVFVDIDRTSRNFKSGSAPPGNTEQCRRRTERRLLRNDRVPRSVALLVEFKKRVAERRQGCEQSRRPSDFKTPAQSQIMLASASQSRPRKIGKPIGAYTYDVVYEREVLLDLRRSGLPARKFEQQHGLIQGTIRAMKRRERSRKNLRAMVNSQLEGTTE